MFGPGSYDSLKSSRSLVFILLASCLLLPIPAIAKNVLIATPLGDIEIELLEEDAPETVANFLNYVEDGRFLNTFIHRSAPAENILPRFVIQGGGFTFESDSTSPADVPAFAPVINEFKISNTRGTVAMAKVADDPNSATSQWFINMDDNSENLDNQNGGFTVFAKVVGDGMTVADAISTLPLINAGGAFGNLPVIDYISGNILVENLVMTAVSVVEDPFAMNAGLNDAWFDPATDGQGFFVTVFPDLNFVSLAWFTYDTELPAEDDSANLGDPGHRWLTAGGVIEGNRAVMDITVTSGGIFDAASDIQRLSDGVITLTFDDCVGGLIEYDITSIDQQGSVPIQRVANDNIALCEALSAATED